MFVGLNKKNESTSDYADGAQPYLFDGICTLVSMAAKETHTNRSK